MRLQQYDIDRALKLLPEKVKALLISNGKSLVVAGGFLRCVVAREHIKDIDLFSKSREEAKKAFHDLQNSVYPVAIGVLENIDKSRQNSITTSNAYSLKNVDGHFVQFIHRWTYPTPEDLIASFDFTISKAALWYDRLLGKWDSVVDDGFYPDLAARRLVFAFPDRLEEPAGSLLRVLKFVKKGYNIPSESLAGVIAKISLGSQERDQEQEVEIPTSEAGGVRYTTIKTKWDVKSLSSSIHRSINNLTGES